MPSFFCCLTAAEQPAPISELCSEILFTKSAMLQWIDNLLFCTKDKRSTSEHHISGMELTLIWPTYRMNLPLSHTHTHTASDDAVAVLLMRFGITGARFLLNALKSSPSCGPPPLIPTLSTTLSAITRLLNRMSSLGPRAVTLSMFGFSSKCEVKIDILK